MLRQFLGIVYVLLLADGVTAQERVITNAAVGCKTLLYILHVIDLAEKKDETTADNLLLRGLKTGECRKFLPSQKIIVEDTNTSKGIFKAHEVGASDAFWLPELAVL